MTRLIYLTKEAERTLTNVAVLVEPDKTEVELWNLADGQPIRLGQRAAYAMATCPFKWLIVLAVYTVESNGKRKLITQALPLAHRWRHHQLGEVIKEQHVALLRQCDRVVGTAWAASPVATESREQQLCDLLNEERYWYALRVNM